MLQQSAVSRCCDYSHALEIETPPTAVVNATSISNVQNRPEGFLGCHGLKDSSLEDRTAIPLGFHSLSQ